jgi:hypothetical protein
VTCDFAAEYTRTVAPEEDFEPRLFHVSDATGTLRAEEVHRFTQDDLCEDDVFVLDAGSQAFVWIGSKASESEKTRVMEIAQQFIASTGGDADVAVTVEQSGSESNVFTSNFAGWSTQKAATSFVDPVLARRALLEKSESKREEALRKAEEAARARGEAAMRAGSRARTMSS